MESTSIWKALGIVLLCGALGLVAVELHSGLFILPIGAIFLLLRYLCCRRRESEDESRRLIEVDGARRRSRSLRVGPLLRVPHLSPSPSPSENEPVMGIIIPPEEEEEKEKEEEKEGESVGLLESEPIQLTSVDPTSLSN